MLLPEFYSVLENPCGLMKRFQWYKFKINANNFISII